jgi:hypothetical protein
MTDFIAAILEIEKQYGPLSRLLALSWGMSILNAIKKGLKLNAIIIGSGDIVQILLKILLLNCN